ncbi:MAG TPA: hypothetical protein VG796_00090 [Verrucomicrobiales bacterium]|jgi:hypothetical protein|nr:hypothetical protein [Verrucomicrobiales bacterium]
MDLYLQFGHGMMGYCKYLLGQWGQGTVVLSPRDLSKEQIEKFSKEIRVLRRSKVIFDPQLYLPHSEHPKLSAHDYWPANYSTGVFWQGRQLKDLLEKLVTLNEKIGSFEFILPGLLTSKVDEDWLAIQEAVLEKAREMEPGVPLISTIALESSAVTQEQVAKLIERAEQWNADGYYLVCEHPKGEYLVAEPMWIANILDLAAGLRLSGSRVILGYCNHQMLVVAAAKVNAICSGTFMNVRSFPSSKFRPADDEAVVQRSVWFYCPKSLSEYKVPFLDVAHTLGCLQDMRPDLKFGSYANRLFLGPQPTTVGFSEQDSFRHYLNSLHIQTAEIEKATFEATLCNLETVFSDAERILNDLHSCNIRGQKRDFREALDANRAALSILTSTRGPILKRQWSALP